MSTTNLHIAFFGTPEPAVEILDHLKSAGLIPDLIITNPDRPKGKKLTLTPPPAKIWAEKQSVPVLQPEKLDDSFIDALKKKPWDVFIVVAYGKIIPKAILNLPAYGCLNVHYSLLPKYRGASPVESQILADDRDPGVTIMLIDEKMDHGPVIASAPVPVTDWPPTAAQLRHASNNVAGPLLASIVPKLATGDIKPQEQNHTEATYTKLIKKEDGLIDLADDAYRNYLKIQAYAEWPTAYFFVNKNGKNIRVVIKQTSYNKDTNELKILRVVPEGKSEMDYEDFVKGYL